jgi:Lambda phage tail tape-measure protein (Tape_meas_lam_C).
MQQRQYADSIRRINQELQDLKEEGLKGTRETIDGVFSRESVEDFIAAIGKGGDADNALGELADSMLGSGGTQAAINDCFGVKPVQDFGQGIRDLFTGNGSPLGAFQSALGSLSSALGDFFRDGEFKFSAFKDAIFDALADIAAGAVASVGINFLKNLIPGINSGGMIEGNATGGRVTGMGGPKEDKVLARLSPGEYVLNAATVSKFGANFFDQINNGKMPGLAVGGMVGGSTMGWGGGFSSSDGDFFDRLLDWFISQ